MNNYKFTVNDLRMEISFQSFDELRQILLFYQQNNIYKINIPCKNKLKKDLLLRSIQISRHEFPSINIIPHFSIQHQFRKNKLNTLEYLDYFIKSVQELGCNEVLLISGSQKKKTIDSLVALSHISLNSNESRSDLSIGVAFNPYLPGNLFQDEISRLKLKINNSCVTSIWIQFGTDYKLLKERIEILQKIISKSNIDNFNINLCSY